MMVQENPIMLHKPNRLSFESTEYVVVWELCTGIPSTLAYIQTVPGPVLRHWKQPPRLRIHRS